MQYDYTVMDIYGNEVSNLTFKEAVDEGKKLVAARPDCDPVIDQFYKDDELTGTYWKWHSGKFVKANPPISLKSLINQRRDK